MSIIFYTLAIAQARITDFSHANYIPVIDGNVLVFEQRDFLKHTSNLSDFKRIIDETDKMSELSALSHMRKLLDVDIDHIRSLLSTLTIHHRIARSLVFLGWHPRRVRL